MERVTLAMLALMLVSWACSTALAEVAPVQTFFLMDYGAVCLHMEVSISVEVTYHNTTSDENSIVFSNLTGGAYPWESSSCDFASLSAELLISSNPSGYEFGYPMYTIAFSFTGHDNHWSMRAIYLLLNINNQSFPIDLFNFTTTDTLYQEAALSFFQSYTCSKDQALAFKAPGVPICPVVTVQDLQVQAFKFNNRTGEFDAARDCFADGAISRIVPIAVAAALTGLVAMVLVAHLIKRLLIRRESSHETFCLRVLLNIVHNISGSLKRLCVFHRNWW